MMNITIWTYRVNGFDLPQTLISSDWFSKVKDLEYKGSEPLWLFRNIIGFGFRFNAFSLQTDK